MNTKFEGKVFLMSILMLSYDLVAFSQTKNTTAPSHDELYAWMYIVFAGTSLDFNALDKNCQRMAVVANEKYSNHLIYDNQRGMIVPDSSDDELYAGNYFPRRYPEERISIEMLWYYYQNALLVSDSDKRMTIITGIFENKSDAEKNLKKVHAVVHDAYIKRIELYMGCMP